MKIISRTHRNEERCTRKGDLPIEQQRLVDGELEDIVSIQTYDHTETIEFYGTKDSYELGDSLTDDGKEYIVTKKISGRVVCIYTAINHSPNEN